MIDAYPMIWPDERPRYSHAVLDAYPSYLSIADRVRLERIKQARMLFDGQHEDYYLSQGRTQFSFRRIRTADGKVQPLYLTCNVLRLVSLKAADLLMGKSPLISSDVPDQADALNRLADRCDLHQTLYQAAVDASAEGEAFLEAVVYDGEIYIQQVPADEVFPVGEPLPDGQHAAYIRRQTANEGTDRDPQWLLLETICKPGSIERHCHQLDRSGDKQSEVSLDRWPAYRDTTAPSPVHRTGIEWNTLVWVPNLKLRRRAVSDYDGGVIGLQDALNAKHSQLAMVMMKHAQPKLLLPDTISEDGNKANTNDEVFYGRMGELEPKYLTWDAQLDAAQKDRAFTLNQILVQTETSPVLLGLKEGAAPDAYRKVRLEAFNSMTKAARRAVCWTQGLRTILTVASMLEQTNPGVRYNLGNLSIQLRDGIPVDAVDQANELQMLRSAGLKSVRQGLSELLGDQASVDAEMQALEQERAAGTPSVLFNDVAVSA